MPGTCSGSSTSHTANRFWVPASVRSNPGALPGVPRCTRSAIGPLPGRSGAAASLSDHRNQPARDRWAISNRLPGLQTQILAPAVGSDHGLAVQGADRRVEGFEHRQRSDIDATDRQADGMAPQVVDQRFDLGKFGHVSSVPIAARGCPSQLRAPAINRCP